MAWATAAERLGTIKRIFCLFIELERIERTNMGAILSTDSRVMLLSVPVAVATGALAFWWMRKQRTRTYEEVGFVSALNVYPVKSCKAISLEHAECLVTGIKYDRDWVILDGHERLASQRKYPKLALVTPRFEDDGSLCLDAPGMKTLKLPMDVKMYGQNKPIRVFGMWGEGAFAGSEAADWFCKFLEDEGLKMYLVTKARYLNTDDVWKAIAQPQDKASFADYSPFMMATEKSLEYLNKELSSPMPMRRFRPNIVVSGVKEAHLEDQWNHIKIGDVEFRLLNNCSRCTLTLVDPDTGIREDREPLATLRRIRLPEDRDKRYGEAPFFGINLALENRGGIKLGDAVLVSV